MICRHKNKLGFNLIKFLISITFIKYEVGMKQITNRRNRPNIAMAMILKQCNEFGGFCDITAS